MKKNYKNISIILISILILLLGILFYSQWQNKLSGKIIFRRVSKTENFMPIKYQYFVVDFDEHLTQFIGKFRGNPSISKDGNYLAINDLAYDTIELLDISDIKSSQYIDLDGSARNKIVNTINLPEECIEKMSENDGLQAISWNHSNDKLVVVCGSKNQDTVDNLICIFDIEYEFEICWEEADVMNVDYSPVNNEILLSIGGAKPKIYIISDYIQNKEFIIDGTSAVWSPNGKMFVYANDYKIYLYNVKTQNRKLLYDKETIEFRDGYKNYNFHVYDGIYELPHFSWSPNGKNIAFHASRGFNIYKTDIYTINIQTKEAKCISCFNPNIQNNLDPTWGK